MNPEVRQLCDELERAGVQILFTPAGPRMRGSTPPPALKARADALREAVLEEWHARHQERQRRYWSTPPLDLPLRTDTSADPARAWPIILYVARQCVRREGSAHDRKMRDWIETRDARYFAAGFKVLGTGTALACLDLVCWQRDTVPENAIDFVLSLDESARNMKPQPPKEKQNEHHV